MRRHEDAWALLLAHPSFERDANLIRDVFRISVEDFRDELGSSSDWYYQLGSHLSDLGWYLDKGSKEFGVRLNVSRRWQSVFACLLHKYGMPMTLMGQVMKYVVTGDPHIEHALGTPYFITSCFGPDHIQCCGHGDSLLTVKIRSALTSQDAQKLKKEVNAIIEDSRFTFAAPRRPISRAWNYHSTLGETVESDDTYREIVVAKSIKSIGSDKALEISKVEENKEVNKYRKNLERARAALKNFPRDTFEI